MSKRDRQCAAYGIREDGRPRHYTSGNTSIPLVSLKDLCEALGVSPYMMDADQALKQVKHLVAAVRGSKP